MSTHTHASRLPFGAALHALSTLTGQPEAFFLGPADSARGARIEFVATLLLDLGDTDALTARTIAPRPSLLAVIDDVEQAEDAAAGHGLDEETAGGWAA